MNLEQSYFYHKEFTISIIHDKNPLDYFFNDYYHFLKFQTLIHEIIDVFGLSCLLNQSVIFYDMEFEITKFMYSEGKKLTIFIL